MKGENMIIVETLNYKNAEPLEIKRLCIVKDFYSFLS